MILSMQDGQETQLSDLESLLSRTYTEIQGYGAQGTKHNDMVLGKRVHRAESLSTHVVHPHPVRRTAIYTNPALPLLQGRLSPSGHPCG
jgi:hypothetical protein